MRVQGGSNGLITAILHGTIDALDADRDERTEKSTRYTEAEWRALKRRRGFVHRRSSDKASPMTNPVPIVAPLDPDVEAKVRAFATYLEREVRDFAARNGAPGSLALVILSDICSTPLSYSVRSWTPGDDSPTKVAIQATAVALLQASIASAMVKASSE